MAAEAVGNVKYCRSYLRGVDVEVSRVYDDGYLFLEEDPVAWIESHPAAADRLSVRILELKWMDDVDKITDMIGELSELTHLYFYWCPNLKSLTDTITRLSNLQLLKLEGCYKLEELPENLGELESLTHLSISSCRDIKSLPNSLTNLSNLTTLDLFGCDSLTELPPNLNVIHLIIKHCCSIKALPTGLSNLASLHLKQSHYCLANLKDSLNLRHLTLESCDFHGHANVIEFLPNLDELLQLSLVDIQDTKVRYLPWSITKLLNLKILCLPGDFILETLPYHLNDSVIISMKDCHNRKTWKELKTEIQVKNLGISMSVPRNPSCYLWLDTNKKLHPWLQNNYHRQPFVKSLHLQFLDDEFGDLKLLKELTHVTHLYISGDVDHCRLPDTLTNITHLSLHHCYTYTDDSFKSLLLDSLAEPSNLVSLDVDLSETYLPSNIHQFVNLKCLTVRNDHSEQLVPDDWEKLSNLKSLVLYRCYDVSLPTHLNLTNLKLFDCFFKNVSLLPTSIHRLELWHSKYFCCKNRYCSKEPIVCLNQLVNLKTLSITCYKYTSNLLPSIAGLRNLKELQLKDCFGLKELPPDLDELVELSILNISGTRVKSFPDCITKLQKLKHVVLPKCFKKENLPINFETTYDVTDEEYYENRGYYDSDYDTFSDDESNEFAVVDSAESADELVSEYSQEGIIAQQISANANVNQLLGDTHFNGRSNTMGESSQVQEMETSSTGLNSYTNEINLTDQMSEFELIEISSFDFGPISSCDVNNIAGVENNHNASEYTQNNENSPSDENQGKRQEEIIHEKNPCLNLMDKIMTQVNLGKELGDTHFNGRSNTIGESSHDEEMETSSTGLNSDTHEINPQSGDKQRKRQKKEITREKNACLLGKELGEFNHNGREDAVDGISHRASLGLPDQDMENMPVGNDKDSTSTIVRRGKRNKIEFNLTREQLQSYWSRNMTVEDVALELRVARSSFRRWLTASEIPWQTSRISKSQCANNKNTNTASSSGSKPAEVNLVKPFNTPTGHEHAPECLSDANECVVVNNFSLAVTTDAEGEPGVATRCHSNGREQASDALVGTNQGTRQESPSLSKFVVKATYKDDDYRIELPSTASFHELKKEVARTLELEMCKFKIRYKDEDNEWTRMSIDSHLKHLMDLSRSSGKNVIRLSVIDL